MLSPNPKPEGVQVPTELHPRENSPIGGNAANPAQTRTIRYMDDDVFRRNLDEVVTVHDRLLSKLAE